MVFFVQISVAAGSDVYAHWASFVVGVTAAVTYVIWCQLLYFFKIDDPTGVIAGIILICLLFL
jgi:ammonia channel protein AmtB